MSFSVTQFYFWTRDHLAQNQIELENCGKEFSVRNVDLWQGSAFKRGFQYRQHLKEAVLFLIYSFKLLNRIFSLQSFWNTVEKQELKIALRKQQYRHWLLNGICLKVNSLMQ